MPEFQDFIKAIKGGKPVNIKVGDIVRAQAKPGSVEGEGLGKMKDIADMFVSAQKQVEDESRTFGNKDVIKELIKIDKRFVSYANNLSDTSFYLKKFSDENTEVTKEDAEKLQALLKENERIVNGVNAQRKQDKDYNERLMEKERMNEFHFRSQGIMQVEQQRIEKKNAMSGEELWKGISDNVDNLKDEIKTNMKDALLEGIGGPFGSMVKKVFIPGFKAIKDSSIGKFLGPKLGELGGRIGKMFSRSEEDQQELIEGVKSVGSGIDIGMEEVSNDIVAPDTSSIKRRVLKEETARKSVEQRQQNSGIFRKIYEENLQTRMYLKELVTLMKGDKLTIDESLQDVAEQQAIVVELSKKNTNDQIKILQSEKEMTSLLSQINETNDVEVKKEEYVKDLMDLNTRIDKESDVEADSDRENDMKMQTKILDELKDGQGGIMTSILSLLPLLLAGAGAAGIFGKIFKQKKKRQLADVGKQELAAEVGGEEGAAIQEALAEQTEAGFKTSRELDEKVMRLKLGGSRTLEELKPLQEIQNKRNDAIMSALAKKGGLPKTEEGKYQIPFESLKEESAIGSTRDLIKAAKGRAVFVGNAKRILGKEEENQIFDPEDIKEDAYGSSMGRGDIRKFERAAGFKVGEALEEKYDESIIKEVGQEKDTSDKETSDIKDAAYLDIKQSLMPVKEELDNKMKTVEKEREALSAEMAMVGKESNTKTISPSKGGGVSISGKKQKNLDEISILPSDNFGLILVNGGLNII